MIRFFNGTDPQNRRLRHHIREAVSISNCVCSVSINGNKNIRLKSVSSGLWAWSDLHVWFVCRCFFMFLWFLCPVGHVWWWCRTSISSVRSCWWPRVWPKSSSLSISSARSLSPTDSEVFILYSLKLLLRCHYNFPRGLLEIKAFRESSFSSVSRNVYPSLGLYLIAMLWDTQLLSNKNAINPTIVLLLLYKMFLGTFDTHCEICECEAEQSKSLLLNSVWPRLACSSWLDSLSLTVTGSLGSAGC